MKRFIAAIAVSSFAVSAHAAEPRPARPLGNPGEWVTAGDYPSVALRNDQEGTVGFLIDVDVNGVPSSCKVSMSSGSTVLDDATCQLIITRARFEPATDKKGRAISGTYANSVRWIIPKDINIPAPKPVGFKLNFTVGTDGAPTDCSVGPVGRAPMPERLPRTPCDEAGVTFEPFVDANGNAVAKRVTIANSVTIEDVPH